MKRPERYEFGDVTLDVAERRLTCGAAHVHLSPKAFDVLALLVDPRFDAERHTPRMQGILRLVGRPEAEMSTSM